MSKRADILLVGQTPPPLHGQAVVTAMLFDHDWGELRVQRLRMGFSDDLDSVGVASWHKVWRLVCLIVATWSIVFRCRPKALYYLPASPNITPIIRDIVYLLAVRWMFPKVVYHHHAGGLGEFLDERRIIKKLALFAYGRMDCSIDVNITTPPSGEYFNAQENVVVMNGLDVGSAQRQPSKTDNVNLLYVGMLSEEKGVFDLIDLAKSLKINGYSVCFQLVGGWPSLDTEDKFKTLSQSADVLDMFHFSGVLSGNAKWQAYADGDVFLFPTQHPTETFGLVLIEAMAFGLPIVTNRWRGIPHVIGDSGCAEMCKVRCPDSLLQAVEKLLSNQGLRKSMGAAGVKHYTENFTKDVFISRMEQVFRDTINTNVEA